MIRIVVITHTWIYEKNMLNLYISNNIITKVSFCWLLIVKVNRKFNKASYIFAFSDTYSISNGFFSISRLPLDNNFRKECMIKIVCAFFVIMLRKHEM